MPGDPSCLFQRTVAWCPAGDHLVPTPGVQTEQDAWILQFWSRASVAANCCCGCSIICMKDKTFHIKYGNLNIFVQLIFPGLDIHLVHPGRHLHHLLHLQEKIFTLVPAASQGLPRDSAGRWCLRYLYGQTPPRAGHQVELAVAHP